MNLNYYHGPGLHGRTLGGLRVAVEVAGGWQDPDGYEERCFGREAAFQRIWSVLEGSCYS